MSQIVATIDASTKTKPAVNLIVDEEDLDVLAYALGEGIRGSIVVEHQDRILQAIRNRRPTGGI